MKFRDTYKVTITLLLLAAFISSTVEAQKHRTPKKYWDRLVPPDANDTGELDWAIAVPGWTEQVSSSGFRTHEAYAESIVVTPMGNIITTGSIRGSLDFDPSEGEYFLYSEREGMFLACYDCKGALLWAFTVPGWIQWVSSSGFYSHEVLVSDLAIDNRCNIYVTGTLLGKADFDPDEGIYELETSPVAGSSFVACYNSNGHFQWAFAINGRDESLGRGSYRRHSVYATSLCVGKRGQVHLAGMFYGSIDFDPGEEELVLTADRRGVFIATYSSWGILHCAKSYSGTFGERTCGGGSQHGPSLAATKKGYSLTTTFRGSVTLDPCDPNTTLVSGRYGMLLADYDQLPMCKKKSREESACESQ